MRVSAQKRSRQTLQSAFDAVVREQERLRQTLSPEELAEDHRQKVEKFNQCCEEISREAAANGLTEEILAAILAEE